MPVKRICVFCGKPPRDQNLEHVIPRWLIALTGDPKRNANFGLNFSDNSQGVRNYSFDSFSFPSCTVCNSDHSPLESRAKATVEKLLNREPIGSGEILSLLDWLDKVRVGVWLGLRYLDRNYLDFEPEFTIESRIAKSDRLALIYRDSSAQSGLHLFGVNSPVFHTMPSCFVLSINDVHIFNSSAMALISPRLGLPTLRDPRKISGRSAAMEAQIINGTGRVSSPLLPYTVKRGGAEFYQPISFFTGNDHSAEAVVQAYDNDYCKQFIPDPANGQGKIFHWFRQQLLTVTNETSADYLPQRTFNRSDLVRVLALIAAEWQEAMLLRDFRRCRLDFDSEKMVADEKELAEILKLHHELKEYLRR